MSKILIFMSVAAILFYGGCRFFVQLTLPEAFKSKISRQDAIKNYFDNERSIQILVAYFRSRMPKDREVSFGRGENGHSFAIGVDLPNGSVDPKIPNIGGPDLKEYSDEMDSVLSFLHWTNTTIDTLDAMLKKSNCLNIMSGDPVRIQFRYSGLGLHEYLLFNKPLSDSVVKMYETKFGDTVIRGNVVAIYTTSL